MALRCAFEATSQREIASLSPLSDCNRRYEQVKNDPRHLSLFRDYKPLWEKEEVERTERWKKFLVCLAEESEVAQAHGWAVISSLCPLQLSSIARQNHNWCEEQVGSRRDRLRTA